MNNIFISDIHGVVADLHTPWLQLYSDESNHKMTPAMMTDWDISGLVLPEWKDRIWEIYEREYLPGLVQPIEGALEGITKLRALGWRVLFVTSPSNNENPYRWLHWLNQYGFDVSMSDFYPARDKSVFMGRIILDDNPANLSPKVEGRISILYKHPWNQNCDLFFQVDNWKQVIATVEDDDLIKHGKIDTWKTIRRWKKLGLIPDTMESIRIAGVDVPVRLDPNMPENEIRIEDTRAMKG